MFHRDGVSLDETDHGAFLDDCSKVEFAVAQFGVLRSRSLSWDMDPNYRGELRGVGLEAVMSSLCLPDERLARC